MPRAAMIFAAGLGTRMGALTRDIPKPLVKVAGRPLIDYALDLTREAGVERLVVNSHAHAQILGDHLMSAAPEALVSRESKRLETGGGLKRALPLLGPGPVFTLNADMVWRGGNPLDALRAGWRPGMGALLCLVRRPAAIGHHGPGDFELKEDGRLVRRGLSARASFVYAGAQIIDTRILTEFPEDAFSLNVVWNRLLNSGSLFGIVHAGSWVDVGTPEGIALAEAELAR